MTQAPDIYLEAELAGDIARRLIKNLASASTGDGAPKGCVHHPPFAPEPINTGVAEATTHHGNLKRQGRAVAEQAKVELTARRADLTNHSRFIGSGHSWQQVGDIPNGLRHPVPLAQHMTAKAETARPRPS